jgi:hypothetical protein
MTLGDYLALIGSWHSTRPKYMNTIAALIQPLVDAQAMLAQLTADFDLDTAIGIQLDQVGQWIGRTRYIEVPITGVYFTFDDGITTAGDSPRTGFDQGVWFNKYDPTEKIAALDDETYRSVLKLQAIANHWDGTLPSIADAFHRVFPGAYIQDLGDTANGLMAMDVLLPGPLMSTLMIQVLQQDFPIKPSGVFINFIETTVSTEPIFGFDADTVDPQNPGPLAGFDIGSWGKIISTL